MRIGELGKAIGVDVETIRYYEKAGLLLSPARRDNGYRSYGEEHLERQLAALRSCCAVPHTAADCGILHELVTAAHQEGRGGGLNSPGLPGSGKRRRRD